MNTVESTRSHAFKFASPVLVAVAVATAFWVSAGDLDPPTGAIQPTNRVQLNQQVVTLPYTISQPGSYVLTSELTGSSGQDGIIIDADEVTLDLNGFALVGVSGSLNGVVVSGSHTNIAVSNGTVVGWGGDGLNAIGGANSQFERLRVSDNGGNGISAGTGSLLTKCTASANTGAGVQASTNAYVLHNTCTDNGVGVHVTGEGNRIEANQVTGNGIGIDVDGTDNLIVKNSARGNTTDYDIASGNSYGPIVHVGGVGDITAVANSDHPWANFGLTCAPSAEICDGADNDCDGQIDEDFPTLGQVCSVGVGECYAEGTIVCNLAGDGTECDATAGTPTAEVCDGLDNDCDGAIDDGNPGGGGYCDTGLSGVCADGTLQCQGGALVCVQDTQALPEVCDGLDNDCDGTPDEGNPGGGGYCDTGLLGVCADGTLQCQGGALVCVQDTQASSEICDGLDNDCDGTVDEGACANGTACTNPVVCLSTNCIDGVCCDTACGGVCEACDLPGDEGTCALVPAGDDPDSECAGTTFCTGTGQCCKVNGDSCNDNAECCSANCYWVTSTCQP